MNMNIHINRQVEEADGCWPVTFALPNISTEGNSCPGSATQPTSCKVKPGLPHSLFYSFKGTTYVISLFLFSSPKLSCYHWQVFDISLINSYPTTMIAAEMRVTGNWREGVGGGRAVTSVDIALNWIIRWASLGSWAHPHSCFSKRTGCIRADLIWGHYKSNERSNLRCLSCDMNSINSTAAIWGHCDCKHISVVSIFKRVCSLMACFYLV